jgi:hypothetical protein
MLTFYAFRMGLIQGLAQDCGTRLAVQFPEGNFRLKYTAILGLQH